MALINPAMKECLDAILLVDVEAIKHIAAIAQQHYCGVLDSGLILRSHLGPPCVAHGALVDEFGNRHGSKTTLAQAMRELAEGHKLTKLLL